MSICRTRWAAWAMVLTVVGCQPADEIRSYTVPKEAAMPAMHAAAAESSESVDRMIVAILPDGDQAWFLKVAGPLAAVDRSADAITKFFETVRVAPGKLHPEWKLPDGWKQLEGTGMRAATISIPSGDENLEMTVTTLGWSGGQDELLLNVNRWRRQMQLAPIGVVALAKFTHELKAGDATMTIVDLEGKLGSTGMTPPFAQQAQRAGSSSTPAGGDALPAGHPPIGGAGSMDGSAAALKFDTPASWKSLPPTGFRKAAFEIASGAATAKVTVTNFSAAAGPMITDLLSNLNRWRSELALAPISEAELSDVTESIDVDGTAGTFFDVIPDTTKPAESQAVEGTLAVMLTRGETVWFFKLKGDRDLVAAERDNFQAFLKSVRFTPDKGADDGD